MCMEPWWFLRAWQTPSPLPNNQGGACRHTCHSNLSETFAFCRAFCWTASACLSSFRSPSERLCPRFCEALLGPEIGQHLVEEGFRTQSGHCGQLMGKVSPCTQLLAGQEQKHGQGPDPWPKRPWRQPLNSWPGITCDSDATCSTT